MEENKKSVKERIVIISNEIRIAKAGRNDFTKSGYFQPDDILKALNPLLKEHRLIAVFNMEYDKTSEMYKGSLSIEDFDNTDGNVMYKFDIPMQELKAVGAAQSAGATQTYCKRYMFMNAFNLADNKADLDNSKNKPSEPADYAKKLKAAKTVEELRTAFMGIPKGLQKQYLDLKDELKMVLTEAIPQ